MIKRWAHKNRTSSKPIDVHVDVLYLRFIQLFAYFAIVLVARMLAGFSYRAEALLVVFLAAVFLQYNAGWVCVRWGRWRGWPPARGKSAVLWYSSYVDVAVVVSLIYLTGTVESPFMLLIAVPLFFAGNIFPWRTTVRSFLSVSIFSVAVLAVLEMYGIIPHNNCYFFDTEVHLNGHYLAGLLLAVGAIVALVLFLSTAFQDRLYAVMERLRRKGRESENRINELSRLYDISLGINSAISMETLLKIVAKEATILLEQPWASILLFNAKQEIVHSVFVGLQNGAEASLDKKIRRGGLSEWIWTHNSPVVVEDTKKDKRADYSELIDRYGIRSVIGFPLTTGKTVLGVIYAGDFQSKTFEDNHVRLLTTLSAQLSTAIERSKLHESLERKIRTLSQQIEALEKANILKSDFVTHVSHELRTPLTSIKAYVETLTTNIADPKFQHTSEFLDIVSKETERLIRIVNDILDVSKIEFGQRPLQRSVFGLAGVIDDVVSMLAPSLCDKNVSVDVRVPEVLPNIDADPDLMKQVFINLISNAVKYSPSGSQVRISASEEPVDIVVTVEDNGVGIPETELDHIFDKYFRVRSAHSSGFEGVGLGLAIVKNIIEQHGGTIRVESREGEGSRFIFSIPREHCFNDLIGYIAEVVDAKEQLHEMLELIVRMIAELLSVKVVSLMLLDKTRSELFIKMSYGLDEWIVENTRVKVGEGIAGKVAETGEPLFIHNIEENEIYSCPNNPQYETVSLLSVPLVVNDIIVGVVNVNNKTSGEAFDQDDLSLLSSFGDRISRALERVRIVEDSHAFLEDTIEAFRRMLETQSKTKMIEAIVARAVKVSRKLGLSEKDVSVVQYVASVHDIGMTEISDEILNKALHLTDEERQTIRRHPQRGAELIRPLEFVELVSNIILYHHERVDGEGYPMGLKGEEIPAGARILAVIDAFQSMTMGRPYKRRLTVEEAVTELVDHAGRQFDPEVVDAFLTVLKEEGRISAQQVRDLGRRMGGSVPTGT
jgi:signal transduction histidine kinase/HD-GYP domain-containing protein (c-di-GMP phosphodiesterase class II)